MKKFSIAAGYGDSWAVWQCREAFFRVKTVRFNPERVTHQSLGSTRSGAPQVRDGRSPRTLKGFHKAAIDRSSSCGTPLGFNRILLCFSWGAPCSRRPQALLCNPGWGWKTDVDGVAHQSPLHSIVHQDSVRRSSSYSYSALRYSYSIDASGTAQFLPRHHALFE